jgi:putative ABC transport system substrate-binding protein
VRADDLTRRMVMALLGGAAAWSPLAARAQQRTYRIGVLETVPLDQNAACFGALRKGLSDLGYVEGRNLAFEYRSADGRPAQFPALAAQLIERRVDLLVTRGTPAVMAAKNVTSTIPVVMAASGEPIGTGVVGGLARPGGNVTGLSAFTVELFAKRLELLKEAVPGITRIALLHNPDNPVVAAQWQQMKAATQSMGVGALMLDARKVEDLDLAFDTAAAQRVSAVVVGNDTVLFSNRRRVVELAAKQRLPAMYLAREFVDSGGLMTYAVNYPDLYRRAATFVDKIFKGSKPSDLPIEQPTKFELVVNLNAAKAIGLTIPESFLLRADEVIG